MNYQQVSCLITGATGGIGEAIASSLNAKGARLILVGRNSNKLDALQQSLGGKHRILPVDITSEQGREELIGIIKEDTSINMLIQAAGTSVFSELISQSPESIESTIMLNLTTPMLIMQKAVPIFLNREIATIINVGSAFGSIGFACFASYCASKFGLRGFTESMQREYAETGLNIKYFAPRATKTNFNSKAVDELNIALGNQIDNPKTVAAEFIKLLEQDKKRLFVGWPEKLFCRLNGAFPELVDMALKKKRNTILQFAKQNTTEGVSI